jgi:hypothetical protein
MIKKYFYLKFIVSGLFIAVFLGCTTVPKETVELSYIMGENISSIKSSYISLINTHFDLLKMIRIEYLEDKWIPKFTEEWIKNGKLVEMAKGEFIWSSEQGDFISPVSGAEKQSLTQSVNFWSMALIDEIEEKRKELIDPLEDQKKELLALVEEAFDRLYRGNASITAYLNSIRKIQEIQDEILMSLNLTDLRNDISLQLQNISEYANEKLEL